MRGLISTRAAVPADAEAIARLQIACWRENFRGLIDAAAMAAIDESEWGLRRREFLALPERACRVAEEEGILVGFGDCGPVRDLAYAPAGEVLSLFVKPGHQGGGVGKALFGELAETLRRRGYPRLVVKTLRDSPRSRGFYERQGCALTGESSFEFAGRRYAEAVYGLSLPRSGAVAGLVR